MPPTSHRITWAQLPPEVRAGVEQQLGEPVVEAVSQPGGYSPGSADRVRLASGRRAFVKAVSADVNATSVELHRREAAISAALPPGVPAPKILGMYDDGTWVALALADVAGRHPHEPWEDAELLAVFDALAAMAALPLPADLGLPRHEESLGGAFRGWEKLARRPLEGLDSWAAGHLGELAAMARTGADALVGESLVHGDLRADNILLTGQGAVLVDWPWADVGVSWSDALAVLIDANSKAPNTGVGRWLGEHPVFAGATEAAVNGVLAGYAGYFLDMARRPAPPGIPTLRTAQRHNGDAVLGWLKQRLGS
ncbi:hypothetical protein JOF48_000205 [Arthrobacter stackebrandtii]|uniref:Aminoglycoside phosphotransferase domain-containing protein n=1 Tax=Arthrobacter stackebrandtii TaxID=272161 RepID=A0ABS4YRI4_9MICC|nr:phosphotransferase [Arthrobacter stackebrandtii]MBP2411406.1 hypothetical protein [Arthrobacter stackebrandtii]PYH00307.1 aminoglycoside phosphotransferase [Arthrobacter stackebrandtii]